MSYREVARRVFAYEFNNTTMQCGGGNDTCRTEGSHVSRNLRSRNKSPTFFATPTGAVCNRLFAVGVLTEVDRVKSDLEFWRARVVDPTGVFVCYAGQYQPEAVKFMLEVKTPCFAAVAGKMRVHRSDEGTVYSSLRIEGINDVSEPVRDRWVLRTAEHTRERIKCMQTALGLGGSKEDMIKALIGMGYDADTVEGVPLAVEHYQVNEEYLDSMLEMVENAKITADSSIEGSYEPRYSRIEVLGIVGELQSTGVDPSHRSIMERAVQKGLNELVVEDALSELLEEGDCYEPSNGLYRLVE